jgi:hypothetical protein
MMSDTDLLIVSAIGFLGVVVVVGAAAYWVGLGVIRGLRNRDEDRS